MTRPLLRADLRSRLHFAARDGDEDRLLAVYRDALLVSPAGAKAVLDDLADDFGAACLLWPQARDLASKPTYRRSKGDQ